MISLSFLSDSIGRAVLHSVWEGAALAMLFAVSAWVLRKAPPQIRYVLGCVTLALMVFAPIVTAMLPRMTRSVAKPSEASVSVVTTPSLIRTPSASVMAPGVHVPDRDSHLSVLQVAALGWCIGLVVVAVWQFTGWISVQSLVRRAQPADDSLVKQLNRLRDRVGIRFQIAIRVCGEISTPAVVGWLRPVILIPVTALTELPADYFESLLLHELAHIRRHDYLVNLLQTAVETLLFYHPAAWWVSGAVRQEREYCCDDATVREADRRIYIRALAMMESLRVDRAAPFAIGAANGGLIRRIERLTCAPQRRRTPQAGSIGVLAVLSAVVIACACHAARQQKEVSQKQPETKPASSQVNPSDLNVLTVKGALRVTSPTVVQGTSVIVQLYVDGRGSVGPRYSRTESYVSKTGDLHLALLDAPLHVVGLNYDELKATVSKAYSDAGFDEHAVQGVGVSTPQLPMQISVNQLASKHRPIHLMDAIDAMGGIESLNVKSVEVNRWVRPDDKSPMHPGGYQLVSIDKLLAGDPDSNPILNPGEMVVLMGASPTAGPPPATQPAATSSHNDSFGPDDLKPWGMVIGVSDLVSLNVEFESGNGRGMMKRIGEDGVIPVPMSSAKTPEYRKANVVGLDDAQAQEAVNKIYRDAGVKDIKLATVSVMERRSNSCVVIGYLKSPGQYRIPNGSSRLTDLIYQAGGVTAGASPTIVLKRQWPNGSAERQFKLAMDKVLAGDEKQNVYVRPGDQIQVGVAEN